MVIGAGLAGLASARVLSDHFEEVLLLDRDPIDRDSVRLSSLPTPSLSLHLLVSL